MENIEMSTQSSEEKCQMLTEIEAAKYIGMSQSFLRQDRMNGFKTGRTKGPTFIRVGCNIRYHLHDLDAWMDEHRVIRQAY